MKNLEGREYKFFKSEVYMVEKTLGEGTLLKRNYFKRI